MFEAMMLAFQEQTARHLFRMQILAPDGTPIETAEQFATLQQQMAQPQTPPPAQMPSPDPTHWQPEQQQQAPPPPVVPTRAPATTIDALEREFELRKQRELQAAAAAGSGGATETTQRRTGQDIGRNDPCFCGSGKKYKKCHGANA